MDGCNKCCEIDSVSFTCKSLQVLSWNNTIIEKINGSNRRRQITDFIQYIHSKNSKFKRMRGCNCSFIIENGSNGWLQLELRINSIPFKYLSNTLYIRNSWLQVLFFKKPYPLRNGWLQLLLWNKETLYPKKLFPATKRSNL